MGSSAASYTGTRAGAIAGAQAGRRAGAEAGGKAGETAAAEMTLKTLNDGLKDMPINGKIFEVQYKNGIVTAEPETGGNSGPEGMKGEKGEKAEKHRGGGEEAGAGEGVTTVTAGKETSEAVAATGGEGTAAEGEEARAGAAVAGKAGAVLGAETGKEAAENSGVSSASRNSGVAAVMIPKDGQDANALARAEIYETGGAKTGKWSLHKIVD